MADVTLSSRCTSLDQAHGTCRLSGMACPFAAEQKFSNCPDCTFLAQVVMAPDEFHILLDPTHTPARGTLPLKKCRTMEYRRNAAGVHLSALLQSAEEPLLDTAYAPDGGVEYHCPQTDVRFAWKSGKFIPL